MDAETRVRVKEHKAAHPALYGATGTVMYTNLPGLIVMVRFDKLIDGMPGFYSVNFHSVAVEALEVIEP